MPSFNPLRRAKPRNTRFDMETETAELGHVISRDSSKASPPIVSISVGSTGMKRTSLWASKMAAMGCADRIQSLLVYDCHRGNVSEWMSAVTQAGLDHLSITPEYVPLSDGFLRRPDGFLDHYGPIERDMERMVDQLEHIAGNSGVKPQIILEWIGFGGHASLSYLLHEMVTSRFPASTVLPIYCLPAERILEANIRDYHLWQDAEHIIGPIPSIITDNRVGSNTAIIDERIATSLAAIEASAKFHNDAGTLAETVSMFGISGARWISVQSSDMPIQIAPDRPQRNPTARDARISNAEMAQHIKLAIREIAEPVNNENTTAKWHPHDRTAEARIYCIIPYDTETVREVRHDVEDQLKRERFELVFPGTHVYFAAANSHWGDRTDAVFTHLFKLTGLPTEPQPISLSRIIEDSEQDYQSTRRFLSWGEWRLRNDQKFRNPRDTANRPNPGRDNAPSDHPDGSPATSPPDSASQDDQNAELPGDPQQRLLSRYREQQPPSELSANGGHAAAPAH